MVNMTDQALRAWRDSVDSDLTRDDAAPPPALTWPHVERRRNWPLPDGTVHASPLELLVAFTTGASVISALIQIGRYLP